MAPDSQWEIDASRRVVQITQARMVALCKGALMDASDLLPHGLPFVTLSILRESFSKKAMKLLSLIPLRRFAASLATLSEVLRIMSLETPGTV